MYSIHIIYYTLEENTMDNHSKILLYVIIIILFFIILYHSFYTPFLREGATSNIRTAVSPEQCANYATQNPVLDSTNIQDFVSCVWPNAIVEINQVSNLLSQVQTGPTSSYLLNTFSQDMNNASTATSLNSPLIGKTWKDATTSLLATQTAVKSDIEYLTYLSAGDIFKMPDYSQGSDIPPYIQQQIDSNKCSPLIDPSFSYTQLQILNQELTKQRNTLAVLETKIADIKSRYPIQFKIGTVSVDTSTRPVPKISISGNIPNPVINFTLMTPQDGPQGLQGSPGPQGSKGSPALPGSKGLDGYWGTDGLYQKMFEYA